MNDKKRGLLLFLLPHLFTTALIIFVSFFANRFPPDASVAGGDFYQILEPSRHASQYFYAWINQIGQGQFNTIFPAAPFYLLLAALDFLGFSSGFISSFYIFFFLCASYFSFYIAIRWIYPTITRFLQVGGGMLYALNYFTLSVFTYPWGFSHHFLFYIFIPPLIALFLKIMFNEQMITRDAILFALAFLFSTVAYTNIAFLAALFLVQLVLFLVFFFLNKVPRKDLLKKMVSFAAIYAFIFGYLILTFYISSLQYQAKLSHSAVMGGDITDFIEDTSNDVLHIFSLGMRMDDSAIGIIYGIVPVFLLGVFLFKKYNKDHAKITFGFYIAFLIIVLLATRLNYPLPKINAFLYKTQFFSLFRSPEKIFIFLPFFVVVLILGQLLYIGFKKNKTAFLILLLLCVPYGFYIGGIVDVLRRADEKHHYIIRVPNEYYRSADIVNQDKRLTSIVSLPYSATNSINWSDYPKWGFIGQDILYLLYDKYFISANVFDHPSLETALSFREYEEQKTVNESNFISLLQNFSVQFILFHKDIDKELLENSRLTQEAIRILQENKIIKAITQNDYFDLYVISDDYIKPIISIENGARIQFIRSNPSQYKILINGIKNKSLLEFHQAHNTEWKLYPMERELITDCAGESYLYQRFNSSECHSKEELFVGNELLYLVKQPVFNETHKLISSYANGWTIDPEYIKKNFPAEAYRVNPDGSIDVALTLYFKPQSYFYVGMLISILTLFGCFGYLGYDLLMSRRSV